MPGQQGADPGLCLVGCRGLEVNMQVLVCGGVLALPAANPQAVKQLTTGGLAGTPTEERRAGKEGRAR